MKLKIGFIVASTFFLVIALFNPPLTFAQDPGFFCMLNVKCTNLVTNETDGFFSFTVSSSDTDAPNSIIAVNSDGVENSRILSPGDTVVVNYSLFYVNDLDYSTESGILIYAGPADSMTINVVEIPEFPSIIITPLFMIATLFTAVVYRRKHTLQPNTSLLTLPEMIN